MQLLIHSQTSTVQLLKFGMDKSFHPTHYDGCNHSSMLALNLIHVSKRHPSKQKRTCVYNDSHQLSQYYVFDALACVARPSATMALTISNKPIAVLYAQLLAPSQF